jgi:hypothetical protein
MFKKIKIKNREIKRTPSYQMFVFCIKKAIFIFKIEFFTNKTVQKGTIKVQKGTIKYN